jgi:hypothetical protein
MFSILITGVKRGNASETSCSIVKYAAIVQNTRPWRSKHSHMDVFYFCDSYSVCSTTNSVFYPRHASRVQRMELW